MTATKWKFFTASSLILSLFTSLSLALPASAAQPQQRYYVAQATIQGSISQSSAQSAEVVLNRLLAANNLDPALVKSITVQDDPKTLNAGTDGQNIIITTGLWNKLTNNDQKAFVIGHELSHIVLHHIGQTQVRRVGLTLLQRLFSRKTDSPILATATNVGLGLIDKKSSRTLEYQADDQGMQLLTKAGYRPQGALEVFNILEAAAGSGGPEFLSDHPISRSRMQALVNKYKIAAN